MCSVALLRSRTAAHPGSGQRCRRARRQSGSGTAMPGMWLALLRWLAKAMGETKDLLQSAEGHWKCSGGAGSFSSSSALQAAGGEGTAAAAAAAASAAATLLSATGEGAAWAGLVGSSGRQLPQASSCSSLAFCDNDWCGSRRGRSAPWPRLAVGEGVLSSTSPARASTRLRLRAGVDCEGAFALLLALLGGAGARRALRLSALVGAVSAGSVGSAASTAACLHMVRRAAVVRAARAQAPAPRAVWQPCEQKHR